MAQATQDQRQQPVAVLAIGRTAKGEPLRLVAQVPVNLQVGPPVKLVLDIPNRPAKAPLTVAFRHCTLRGCFAEFELRDEAVLRRLRARPAEAAGWNGRTPPAATPPSPSPSAASPRRWTPWRRKASRHPAGGAAPLPVRQPSARMLLARTTSPQRAWSRRMVSPSDSAVPPPGSSPWLVIFSRTAASCTA